MRRLRAPFLAAILIIFACSPSAQIQKSVEDARAQTQSARPTPPGAGTPVVTATTPKSPSTPAQTPSAATGPAYPAPGCCTPMPTSSATLTVSLTQTPPITGTPTVTAPLTATRTPAPTFTPSSTPSPTPTPVLAPLAGLAITSEIIDEVTAVWQAPPEDITEDLHDMGGGACDVDCVGLRWEAENFHASLTLIIYRTANFDEAIQAASGARFVYLEEGFELLSLPAGNNLPPQTWAAANLDREFILFTSQGPAVISIFWQSDNPLDTGQITGFLGEYAGIQSEILRENGYITVNPQATPLP